MSHEAIGIACGTNFAEGDVIKFAERVTEVEWVRGCSSPRFKTKGYRKQVAFVQKLPDDKTVGFVRLRILNSTGTDPLPVGKVVQRRFRNFEYRKVWRRTWTETLRQEMIDTLADAQTHTG